MKVNTISLLEIGDWGLGIGQSPIPNPQSPIPNIRIIIYSFLFNLFLFI